MKHKLFRLVNTPYFVMVTPINRTEYNMKIIGNHSRGMTSFSGQKFLVYQNFTLKKFVDKGTDHVGQVITIK